MPELQHNVAAWVDILPPSAPGTTLSPGLWLAAAILVITGMIIYRWLNTPGQRSQRQLKKVKSRLAHATVEDNRQLAFEIRQAVKNVLATGSTNKLETNPVYKQLNQQLASSCFQAEPPSRDELQQLVQQAITCLKS